MSAMKSDPPPSVVMSIGRLKLADVPTPSANRFVTPFPANVVTSNVESKICRKRLLLASATKRLLVIGSKTRPLGLLKRAFAPIPSRKPDVDAPAIVETTPRVAVTNEIDRIALLPASAT